MTSAKDVDAYIESAPAAAQPMLREIRRIILDSVPSVTEKVSYGMPSYEHRGQRLVDLRRRFLRLGCSLHMP